MKNKIRKSANEINIFCCIKQRKISKSMNHEADKNMHFDHSGSNGYAWVNTLKLEETEVIQYSGISIRRKVSFRSFLFPVRKVSFHVFSTISAINIVITYL